MITKSQAITLIEKHVENRNIVKHMLALEALMGKMYEELVKKGFDEGKLGGTKEEWMMAGLLHDGDYCQEVPAERQGIEITEWARKEGYDIPGNVAYTMAAHNFSNTKVEPKSLMDWTIFCGDSLTGLIVAAALVLPSRKLSDLKLDSILKRFNEKSFAKGTRREDIALCEEKLGLDLKDFVEISLKAMQEIASDLGL